MKKESALVSLRRREFLLSAVIKESMLLEIVHFFHYFSLVEDPCTEVF